MRPTAHVAYRPAKSYEHTRTYEGSRKEEASRKERRTLSDIYKKPRGQTKEMYEPLTKENYV